MYAVFKFRKGAKELDALFRDDIISRQTLIKRDGASLGLDNATYLLIEGSDASIERARAIAGEFELDADAAKQVFEKIKEAEDEASMGMGAIFND